MSMVQGSFDSQSVCAFVGLNWACEDAPNPTTLLNFRRLLETNGLIQRMFVDINSTLTKKDLPMGAGTIADATIINARLVAKNIGGRRDGEVHQTKKCN